jgi:hypothetical protein
VVAQNLLINGCPVVTVYTAKKKRPRCKRLASSSCNQQRQLPIQFPPRELRVRTFKERNPPPPTPAPNSDEAFASLSLWPLLHLVPTPMQRGGGNSLPPHSEDRHKCRPPSHRRCTAHPKKHPRMNFLICA